MNQEDCFAKLATASATKTPIVHPCLSGLASRPQYFHFRVEEFPRHECRLRVRHDARHGLGLLLIKAKRASRSLRVNSRVSKVTVLMAASYPT